MLPDFPFKTFAVLALAGLISAGYWVVKAALWLHAHIVIV